MRTLYPLLLVVPVAGALAFAGAHASASPAAPGTQPVQPKLPSRPDPKLEPPARIASVKRTPPHGLAVTDLPYTEGPLGFDVEISNGGSALSTTLVVEKVDPAPVVVAKVPIAVVPGERAVVSLVDEGGLKKSCEPTEYRLKLDSGGGWRRLVVNPTCSFGTETIDPAVSAPDTKRPHASKLAYHSVSFAPSTLVCGAPMEIRATVKNDTSTPALGARLVVEAPHDSGASVPFDLAAGKDTRQSVALQFSGLSGDYALRLELPGTAVVQTGWRVNVMRSCALALRLD
jgi:hypothetical protein